MIKKSRYEYPIRPGMQSWIEADQEQRHIACQLPEEDLQASTSILLESVLSYPLLSDIYCYSQINEGILYVSEQFNGLRALLQRNDLAGIILNAYQMPLSFNRDLTDSEQSLVSYFRWRYLEAIASYAPVLSKFSTEEIKVLSNLVLQKEEEANKIGCKSWLYSHLQAQKELSSIASVFVSNCMDVTANTSIYTPIGSPIDCLILGDVLTQAEKIAMRAQQESAYPGILYQSEATKNYNCHSYAWYRQNELYNLYWMNNPIEYMKDGSYQLIQANQVKVGDRIFYGAGGRSHSGLVHSVVGTTIMIDSKWGSSPRFIHDLTNCPYDITIYAFYRCKYKIGHINFINSWGLLSSVIITHRQGNKKQLESKAIMENILPSTYTNVSNFYYKNGIGASFDYWYIEFVCAGVTYSVKNNFFCNITSSDDGNANIRIDSNDSKMYVEFSNSKGDDTKIV